MFIDESHQTVGQVRVCSMATARASRRWWTMAFDALGPGQPAAHVRRVRTPHESSGLRLGYARALRADEVGRVVVEQVIRPTASSIRKWKFVP